MRATLSYSSSASRVWRWRLVALAAVLTCVPGSINLAITLMPLLLSLGALGPREAAGTVVVASSP